MKLGQLWDVEKWREKTYDRWGPHEVIDIREAFLFCKLTEFISPKAVVWTFKEF